jgi:hypothetical protein
MYLFCPLLPVAIFRALPRPRQGIDMTEHEADSVVIRTEIRQARSFTERQVVTGEDVGSVSVIGLHSGSIPEGSALVYDRAGR